MAESGMTALAANASVPREPTVAMLLCGHQMSGCTLGAVWRAMWDAYALASPPSAPAPKGHGKRVFIGETGLRVPAKSGHSRGYAIPGGHSFGHSAALPDRPEARGVVLRRGLLLALPQPEPREEVQPLRRLRVPGLEREDQVPRAGHAPAASDDGHRFVGEVAVGVLRFGHGAGQSGNGMVCPLSACEQSSKNWMLPSVTNEWQREHSTRLPGSSGCAALYVHQHSSPGLWCDA